MGPQITAKRWVLGMTQDRFWGVIGVSQACGSRYESGRGIPEPVKILLDLVYFQSKEEAAEMLKGLRKG